MDQIPRANRKIYIRVCVSFGEGLLQLPPSCAAAEHPYLHPLLLRSI